MKLVIWVVVFALIMPFVSAELLFSQPRAVYNIMDVLQTRVTVQPQSTMNDFLAVSLVCEGQRVELYRNAFNLNAGGHEEVNINTSLSRNIIGSLQGNCFLEGIFGEERATSVAFQLNKRIEINIDFARTHNPGDIMVFKGIATKANGNAAEGFAEIRVLERNLSATTAVRGGSFAFNMTLPQDFAPGQSTLQIHAYEKDESGEITNEGYEEGAITIRAILKQLGISINESSFSPGERVMYRVEAHDQAANPLERDVTLALFSPNNELAMNKIIRTGVYDIIALESNTTPGYWKIEARVGDSVSKKLFYVSEHEDALFELVNSTLIVKNTGNVRYVRSLEIGIGGNIYVKEVDIPVGGLKKFKLSAPDAMYAVKVKDGTRSIESPSVSLTGRAISIGEIKDSRFSPVVITFFFVLLVGLVLVTNFYTRKSFAKASIRKSNYVYREIPRAKITTLPSSNWKKEQVALVALKTENGAVPSSVSDVLLRAQKKGVKVYHEGEYKLALFSSGLTRSNENELLAAKLAKELEQSLAEHNAKGKSKVEFGIGLTNGSIISEQENGTFSFTSVGSLIPSAKRLSGLSKQEILLSEASYKPIMNLVKAEKVRELDAWRLNQIIDRSSHTSFIDSFLKRELKK